MQRRFRVVLQETVFELEPLLMQAFIILFGTEHRLRQVCVMLCEYVPQIDNMFFLPKRKRMMEMKPSGKQ